MKLIKELLPYWIGFAIGQTILFLFGLFDFGFFVGLIAGSIAVKWESSPSQDEINAWEMMKLRVTTDVEAESRGWK